MSEDITPEQRDRLSSLAAANRWLAFLIRARYFGPDIAPGLLAAKDFQDSMNKIQVSAGMSSEDISIMSGALLALAGIDEEEQRKSV